MFISLNWSLTAFLARWISMFSWHQRKVVPTSKSYLYSFFEGFWPEWNQAGPFLQGNCDSWDFWNCDFWDFWKASQSTNAIEKSKRIPYPKQYFPDIPGISKLIYRGANTWELVAHVVKPLDHWLPEDEMDSGFGWQDWSKLFFNIFFGNVIGKILWESTFRRIVPKNGFGPGVSGDKKLTILWKTFCPFANHLKQIEALTKNIENTSHSRVIW